MPKGRKPLPSSIKRLSGNPGKRPLNEREPEPEPGLPEPPDHLDDFALEEWHATGPGLCRMRVLTQADKAVFAAYCSSWSLYRRSWQGIKALIAEGGPLAGLVYQSQSGARHTHPIVESARRSALDLVKFASELGLTPSARARLQIPPECENESTLRKLLYSEPKR